MLYAFAFERVGVVVGDLYFRDPNPGAGQEGAERGVRLEVRIFERPPVEGSIYAAQPIEVAPANLAGRPARDRGRAVRQLRPHAPPPQFRGWEPGRRKFEEDLSADPLAALGARLADLDGLLAGRRGRPERGGSHRRRRPARGGAGDPRRGEAACSPGCTPVSSPPPRRAPTTPSRDRAGCSAPSASRRLAWTGIRTSIACSL